MKRLEEFLKNNKEKRLKIGVVGDAMVDEYYYVNIKKISPEFPIPVMHSATSQPTYSLPGGAANVAYQFKHFNVDVYLISAIDYEAAQIFRDHKINTYFCTPLLDYNIPRKKRFYSDDFPTYRWDVEDSVLPDGFWNYIQNALDHSQDFFDVLIFSDYDKGFFKQEVVDYFRSFSRARYKIVDPKKNFALWKGFDVIKPNYQEAKAWTGVDEVEKQYELIKQTGVKEVVITMGDKGVCFGPSKNNNIYRSFINNSPNSVIGAGDCFMAFMAMALAHDFDVSGAAIIAFEMGALYVQEKHNSPVDISKILKKFFPDQAKYDIPLLPRNYSLCFTNGCFDVLHRGHIETLKFAKSQADKLVVAVNSDASVARLKPGRPINNLANRMALLANLECVDYVVSFDEDTPIEIIKKLQPDVLVKGGDYDLSKVVGVDMVDRVLLSPFIPDLSTTKILSYL